MYNVSFFCSRSGNSSLATLIHEPEHMPHVVWIKLQPDMSHDGVESCAWCGLHNFLLVAWNKHTGEFLLLSLLDEMLANHRFSPSPAISFTPFKKQWDRVSCLRKQSYVASGQHVKKVLSDFVASGFRFRAKEFCSDCPTGKWSFLGIQIIQKNCNQSCSSKIFFGLVEMTFGLVHDR